MINRKLLIISICVFWLAGCMPSFLLSECGYNYRLKLTSPGNNYGAVHYIKDCGATTDFYTFVQIENKHSNKNDPILIIKGYYDTEIKLIWLEDNKLRIDFSGDLKYVENFKPKFEDITAVLYKSDKQVSTQELEQGKVDRAKEDAEYK